MRLSPYLATSRLTQYFATIKLLVNKTVHVKFSTAIVSNAIEAGYITGLRRATTHTKVKKDLGYVRISGPS